MALIVMGVALLVGGGAGLAALLDPPAPDRSSLGVADDSPYPTGLPSSPAPGTPSASTAPPDGGPAATTGVPGPGDPRTVRGPDGDRRYDDCTQAIDAGLGPYKAGRDIEYTWYPDDDHDGWVCERSPDKPDRVPYRNCDEVRAAGAAPLHRGEPGYGRHLDRDGDGIACDTP